MVSDIRRARKERLQKSVNSSGMKQHTSKPV